jgi:hypothetical protein
MVERIIEPITEADFRFTDTARHQDF